MASFPKAQLKRFNDVEPHGPTPGAHEPGLTPYSDREAPTGPGRLNRSLCPEPLARIQPQPRRLLSKTARTPLSSSRTVARAPGLQMKPAQPCEVTAGLRVGELGRRLASVQEELVRERRLRQQEADSHNREKQEQAASFQKEREGYQKEREQQRATHWKEMEEQVATVRMERESYQKEIEQQAATHRKEMENQAVSLQKEMEDYQKKRDERDTTHLKEMEKQAATYRMETKEHAATHWKESEDHVACTNIKEMDGYRKENEEQAAVCASMVKQIAAYKSQGAQGRRWEENVTVVGQLEIATRKLDMVAREAREKKAGQEEVEENPLSAEVPMPKTLSGSGGGLAEKLLGVAQLEEVPKSGSKMDFGEKKIFFQEKIQADTGSPSFRKRTEG